MVSWAQQRRYTVKRYQQFLTLGLIVLAGCGEESLPVAPKSDSVPAVRDSVRLDPKSVGQYNAFPSGWKFPFSGSSTITVGYNGVCCDPRYFDVYHTGRDQYALDWSRSGGNSDVGDPILAPASGWATAVFSSTGLGNHIRVNAGNGYSYVIGHMDRIYLNYCGWVERGQRLGTLGCTGNCDGAHIHFVVYRNSWSVPQNGISGQWGLSVCGTYASGQ